MIEFRKAQIPDEIGALCDIDRRIFHAHLADLFSPEFWASRCEAYWMILEGKTIGCSAFQPNQDHKGPRSGCLYIASTGVLPEFRGQGFGKKQKEWQIDFARKKGFIRIVTDMRESNAPIIALNKSFGFTVYEVIPTGIYRSPEEAAIVMELSLGQPQCPHCGKLLRTARAKQCHFCHTDWH
jgi:GNAT superfamily N-acetyltransferase